MRFTVAEFFAKAIGKFFNCTRDLTSRRCRKGVWIVSGILT